ncbi:hypothetical protein [Streptomyces phaeolivaceus]|uniref:hypothetical protein n=1 Tax=Streptomyces phaeolivaceus TaxID=2653200 RepID=UPI00186AA921|nr:hypothetical protein [Streptomyces phaeolivaceus]
MKIYLRELQDSDLLVFWEQLTDPELQQMAAVTRKYHYDRGHFDQHWAKVRSDPAVILRTVLANTATASAGCGLGVCSGSGGHGPGCVVGSVTSADDGRCCGGGA